MIRLAALILAVIALMIAALILAAVSVLAAMLIVHPGADGLSMRVVALGGAVIAVSCRTGIRSVQAV